MLRIGVSFKAVGGGGGGGGGSWRERWEEGGSWGEVWWHVNECMVLMAMGWCMYVAIGLPLSGVGIEPYQCVCLSLHCD